MESEKHNHILRQAKKANAQFVRCDGEIYKVTARRFPTGPSPRWSVEKVAPVDIPAYDANEGAEDDFTKKWPIIENDSLLD